MTGSWWISGVARVGGRGGLPQAAVRMGSKMGVTRRTS